MDERDLARPVAIRAGLFDLRQEREFRPEVHVEKVIATVADGDVTVACWEPGQISPYHCHPEATEIYVCFEGGGQMRTPETMVHVKPGSFVVHPPGELHEYANGSRRTLLFRVRYGRDVAARTLERRGNPGWTPSPEDVAYFASASGVRPCGGTAGSRRALR